MGVDLQHMIQNIDEEATSIIIRKHFSNRHISNITMLQGGLNNITKLITCSNNEKYIIKAKSYNIDTSERERKKLSQYKSFHSLMHRNNIQVPKLYFYGILKEISTQYTVLEYMPGISLAAAARSGQNKDQYYEEFGRIVRKMHSIALDQCCDLFQKELNDSWQSSILIRTENWIKNVSSLSCFSKDILRNIENLFAEHANALAEIIQPHFVHGDLWEGNIIINADNDDGSYTVSVIDFDDAMFGDPEMDFPNGYMFNDSFKKGYGMGLSMDRNAIIRRKLYALLYSMEHFYVLECLYHRPSDAEEHYHSIFRIMKQFTSL